MLQRGHELKVPITYFLTMSDGVRHKHKPFLLKSEQFIFSMSDFSFSCLFSGSRWAGLSWKKGKSKCFDRCEISVDLFKLPIIILKDNYLSLILIVAY